MFIRILDKSIEDSRLGQSLVNSDYVVKISRNHKAGIATLYLEDGSIVETSVQEIDNIELKLTEARIA